MTKKSVNARVLNGILVFTLLALACAGGQKTTRPSKTSKVTRDMSGMKEDFNPIDLNDDDLPIEDVYESVGGDANAPENARAASSDTVGTGYRIQIIQTTEPDEARDVQSDAILRFDNDVYRIFDPPFYKVRVGDFVNWNDAESLQKLAIQKGFRDAWVVRTQVNLKKAYRWMDEF